MKLFVFISAVALMSNPVLAAQKKFLAYGSKGASGTFKNEITLFENADDPQPRCPDCKNYRVIVDVLKENMPVGGTLPIAVDFDTKPACGEFAVETPVADLSSLYRHFSSPTMTASRPLLLQVNPSVCTKGDSVYLNLLKHKCMNPTAKGCRDMVVYKAYRIPIADLDKDLKDIQMDNDPLPNMNKSRRTPSSVKPK